MTHGLDTHWSDALPKQACVEAVEWCREQPSLDEAWATCTRADWMLWLLGKLSGAPESDMRKKVVLCACACARTALKQVPDGEDRPLQAIETTERWARGDDGVTLDDVRSAASAAASAAAASAAASASAAAAYAAYAAAYDADAAAYAAAASAAAARWQHLSKLADFVRQHFPQPPNLTPIAAGAAP